MKIISTVPSITELLADLGLDNEVVGITKFCVHPPEWYKTKTRIGGTKTLAIEKIKSLNPTLIIANKEENVKEQILALQETCEVYVTDIKTPEDNLELIKQVGLRTNKRISAIRVKLEMQNALSLLGSTQKTNPTQTGFTQSSSETMPYSAAYLIWQNPYMTVGQDTYIHGLMQKCGFKNSFGHKTRYPETTIEELKRLAPQFILLSSEPFPFKEKHINSIQQQLPNSKVLLVDGEAFSWYGTRLIKKASYLSELVTGLRGTTI